MGIKFINKYIPFLIIAFTVWMIWEDFSFHEKEIERIQSSLPVVENKIKRKTKQKGQIKDFLKNIEEAKSRVKLVAEEISAVQKKLPDTISDARNLEALKNIANELTIKNPSFSQGEEEDKGFYISKSYNFKAEGTYLQFLLFIEKVHNSDLLLNVRSMSLKSPKPSANTRHRGRYQVLEGNIVLEVYRYNDSYKVDTGIEEIESEFQKGGKKK